MLIPNSEIQQLHTDTTRLWYRVGKSIHVTTGKDSKNEYRYTCLTCRTTDQCIHSKAVRRFVKVP